MIREIFQFYTCMEILHVMFKRKNLGIFNAILRLQFYQVVNCNNTSYVTREKKMANENMIDF